MKGTVKFFTDKGFGFITADDGKEYFVHQTGLEDQDARLNEGDAVEFEIEQGDRGPKAVKVVKE